MLTALVMSFLVISSKLKGSIAKVHHFGYMWMLAYILTAPGPHDSVHNNNDTINDKVTYSSYCNANKMLNIQSLHTLHVKPPEGRRRSQDRRQTDRPGGHIESLLALHKCASEDIYNPIFAFAFPQLSWSVKQTVRDGQAKCPMAATIR